MTKRIVQPQNSNKAFQRTDDNNKTRERMKSQNWTTMYTTTLQTLRELQKGKDGNKSAMLPTKSSM